MIAAVALAWFFYAYQPDATFYRGATDYTRRGPFGTLVVCEAIADAMESSSRGRWQVLRPRVLHGYACWPGAATTPDESGVPAPERER